MSKKMYEDYFEKYGSKKAHEYLHTSFKYRKKCKETLEMSNSALEKVVNVEVCVDSNCLKKGSKEILKRVADGNKFKDAVNVQALICLERCSKGPT
jgi:NADH-quinone oxidoreductase subunit G